MSDNDNTPKGKGANKSVAAGWNDHELLVYLLSTIEYSGVKLDYANAPAPAGRTSVGCLQKINKLKIALRAEIDAVKAGQPLPDAGATPTKKGGRKRKADENGEGTPKKRGRSKKQVDPEEQDDDTVKEEVKEEFKGEDDYLDAEI